MTSQSRTKLQPWIEVKVFQWLSKGRLTHNWTESHSIEPQGWKQLVHLRSLRMGICPPVPRLKSSFETFRTCFFFHLWLTGSLYILHSKLMHIHLSKSFFQHSSAIMRVSVCKSQVIPSSLSAHSWLQEEWEAEEGDCNQEGEGEGDLHPLLCEKNLLFLH